MKTIAKAVRRVDSGHEPERPKTHRGLVSRTSNATVAESKARVRLVVELTPEQRQLTLGLKSHHWNSSDYVRRAILVYAMLLRERSGGWTVELVSSDRTRSRELILP